jgi:hypothetical protein
MPKSGQRWISDFLERSALFEDFRELARPLEGSAWPTLDAYTRFAEAERCSRAAELAPVRFVPPVPRPRRAGGRRKLELTDSYDGRVVLRGEVPCLVESYHDFCNVLAWAAFPRSKRALHARQVRAFEAVISAGASRLPNRRTREQDALTLLDEGGCVIAAAGRPFRVVLFGHGLMEHVGFQPTPVGSAAFELCVGAATLRGRELFDAVDFALSKRLIEAAELTPRDFDGTLVVQASDAPDSAVSAGHVAVAGARHHEQPVGHEANGD